MKEKLKYFIFLKRWKFRSILKVGWLSVVILGASLSSKATVLDISNKSNNGDTQSETLLQKQRTITGTVKDEEGNTIPGASVLIKGTSVGTITDIDGKFSIKINEDDKSSKLVISFIGYTTREISVSGKSTISVTLSVASELIDDVVIVGYGVQKKESVVGAISHAKGEDLMKAGGVSDVTEALQGRLPGVTTTFSNGMPGESDPKIFIRGQASWNGGGQPLIVVDGIERSMSNIDLNEIENISVLKDASATAVFGVRGANGVILITTKRGTSGKSEFSISANSTIKAPSKLPQKLDSYNTILKRNEAILFELMHNNDAWNTYMPHALIEKYRNPADLEESYMYPNVDWSDVMLKDYATDHRINLSVRGGNDFAKYFGSLSYQTVSDILKGKEYSNRKGYESEYRYDRFNYRSNLDFNITKTTTFSVNLSGYFGVQEKPSDDLTLPVASIYALGPTIYLPEYPDGSYGKSIADTHGLLNPLVQVNNTGKKNYQTLQVNSDFALNQKLDFITKGLTFNVKISYDNEMKSEQELVDGNIDGKQNVIYRVYDGEEYKIDSPEGVNDFDFIVRPWSLKPMEVEDKTRSRRLNYELAFNYERTFAENHNFTALALVKREQYAKGNMFPRFREDWVSRVTYNYASKYFIDINGAYNGSEKFGPGYRFDVFPSGALGWMVSNENFLKPYEWLDKFKVRGSLGKVGEDNFSGRWKYMSQWGNGEYAFLGSSNIVNKSPYEWYYEKSVGNPDLQWETAVKSNIGLELSLLDNLFTADFDYFTEDRDHILIEGDNRSLPDLYGTDPPDFNSGKVSVKGFELDLGSKYTFDNMIQVWGRYSYTLAKDKVIYKEDPELTPFYQKAEGYTIGQPRRSIPGELMTNWDDIYMSTPLVSNQQYRRIGYYDVIDFDSDGSYNGSYDNAPYGYTDRPERSWNLSGGVSYRGVSVTLQFYGTQNAMRTYRTRNWVDQTPLFYEHSDGYWTKDNSGSKKTLHPLSLTQAADDPERDVYDASLVRLKTAEIAYELSKSKCKKIGIKGLRVFINGNNLFLWSKMPDDREFNGNTNLASSDTRGDYPTVKRFNLGLNLNL